MITKILNVKKKLRKTLGFYYRFIKQYYKNKKVFNNIIALDNYTLTYFSVLKNEEVKEEEVLQRVESGDIIIVKDLISQLNLQQEFDSLSDRKSTRLNSSH